MVAKTGLVLISALMFGVTGRSNQQQSNEVETYTIIDLGALMSENLLGGAEASVAFALNENGEVAGISAFSGGFVWIDDITIISNPGLQHAVRWTDGLLEDLGAVEFPAPGCSPLGCESRGLSINDLGDVAGYSAGGSAALTAILWLSEPWENKAAGLQELPHLLTQASKATALNNSMQIVGHSDTLLPLPFFSGPHPVLWQHDGVDWTVTDLGTLGGPYGRALDINEQGQIVGHASDPNVANFLMAFLYLPSPDYGMEAGMHPITPPEVDTNTDPRAINELGQIVGTATGLPWIWLPEPAYGLPAGFSFLDPPPGGGYTILTDINNHGQIVGTAYVPGILIRAVMWEEGQWIFLNELLPAGSPWTLRNEGEGGKVNDDGVFTGSGLTGQFDENDIPITHAFILKKLPNFASDIPPDLQATRARVLP